MKNFILLIGIALLSLNLPAQNNCLEFDGTDDYISVPDDNSLDLSSSMTIEFWVYLGSSSGKEVISKSIADNNENFRIYIDQSNSSQIYFDYGNKYCQSHSFSLTTYAWYHMAFSVSAGNTGTIYVNGIEASAYSTRETAEATIPTNNEAMQIGGCNFTERYFQGKIDEVRIWDDVRTETEIRQNMYRELTAPSGEANLIAYYKFNETSGTTADDAKGSNNGTLTNYGSQSGYWQTSPAMFGPKTLLDFDGENDYISINSLHMSGSVFTVETWVYLDAFGDPNLDANIANLIRGGDENFVLRIGDGGMPNNMPQFVVNIGGHQRLNANARLNLNTWYHIAGVYDGSMMYLYINGKLDKSQSQTGNLTTTSHALGLGGEDRNLDGQMDEVRIWNTARTASQIRNNMCKSLTGNESGLVAYYNFDNTSGTVLQDFSGNGYNGALQNMDNTDWVSSSAFNTWLNTSSSSWATATNWSMGSKPVSESVGIYSYTGGSTPTFTNGDEAGGGNIVINMSSDWSLGGYFSVSGNLITESDINLNGQTISLGTSAYLIEDEGRIYGSSGQIQTTRNLSNIDENIAGLGAEITTSANMGSTTITRTHVANSSPASIERRFNIAPTNNSGLNATLVFHYNNDELDGLTASALELYKSTDGGTNWTDQNGSINTFHNTITLNGIESFSLWTAMESEEVNPPILETQNPVHDYVKNSPAFLLAPEVTVTTSTNMNNATISISPIVTEDVLSVDDLPVGLSSSWDNSTKILSISGSGSASDYQTALRNVKFETSAAAEDTRTIDFILGDGIGLMIDGEQHYYEVIDNGGSISWDNARSAALAKRFGLAQGYLATVTSQNENDYLAEKVSADTWIGAADSETEGIWKWMDGPEAGTQFWESDLNAGTSSTTNYGSAVNGEYANWWTNEPNNAYGSTGEDCAHMYGSNSSQPGYWNDYYNNYSVQYYIIEYGGDGSDFTTIDYATVVVNGVSWTGSLDSDWATPDNWNNNAVPNLTTDIIIPDVSNDPVISSSTGANCNNLSIKDGAVLTIEAGGTLITNGNIANSGTISISHSIANDDKWHLISMPNNSTTANSFLGKYLQSWDETSKEWVDITNVAQALTAVKGYSLWSPSGGRGNITFTGTPNTGNQSISLAYHDNSEQNDGANLVGNPYPSYIDWDQVSGYGSKYTWDGSAYKAYTQTGSYGTGSRYVAPMEGFFVVTNSNGTAFTLTNAMRTHNSAKKEASALTNGIVLSANSENYSDALYIVFDQSANENFELPSDAWKFISGTAGISQLWSKCPDGNLAVDVRPATETIQLGFTNNEAGTYVIGIKEIADISTAILEDTKLNIFHKLSDGDYSFDWSLNDDETRFKLHLNTTAVEDLSSSDVQAYVAGSNIIIQSEMQTEHITLTDITGRTLGVWKNTESIPAPETPGVYLVTVALENQIVTKKIIIE